MCTKNRVIHRFEGVVAAITGDVVTITSSDNKSVTAAFSDFEFARYRRPYIGNFVSGTAVERNGRFVTVNIFEMHGAPITRVDENPAATLEPARAPDESWARAVVSRAFIDKGFAFVQIQESTDDIFVHFSVLKRAGIETIAESDELLIKWKLGHRGPVATSVRRA